MKAYQRSALLLPSSSLVDHLKGKSRRRRQDLAGLAEAEAARRPRRNDLLPRIELVHVALDMLKMPAREVRKLQSAHVQEIANAISALGFCAPILVGRDSLVLDGAARLEAARSLGFEHVPCVRIEHLSDNEQRVLRLAINRLGETGSWSLEALKIEFEELIVADVPIEISGFSLDEIDQIVLGDGGDGVEKGPLEPDPFATPISKVGDIFQLGPHRIACADATDPEALHRVMGEGEVARLVLTDEPYNVPIGGNVTKGRHREFAMASGEMSEGEFLKFNEAWMRASLPHLHEGGLLGTFIDWRGFPTANAAAMRLGLAPLNLIVWAKTNGGMGSLYRSQHELLPLFKKGSAPHVNNVELGKRGRWRSNVWTYPGASSLGSDARRGLIDHPTVKPTALLEDALLDVSNRGDIVIDPFLGSGSTLIAAETTGRVCRGVELDPLYVDIIVRRYEAATGNPAVFVETGETFNVMAARRAEETAT
jgi:DNA modification methylase